MLGRLGFSMKWRKWIQTCISSTSFAVLINDEPSSFFKASRGLKQVNPFSPMLFIVLMEAMNMMIERAKEREFLRGVWVGKRDTQVEVSHIFFTDNTLIFCQPVKEMVLNL